MQDCAGDGESDRAVIRWQKEENAIGRVWAIERERGGWVERTGDGRDDEVLANGHDGRLAGGAWWRGVLRAVSWQDGRALVRGRSKVR